MYPEFRRWWKSRQPHLDWSERRHRLAGLVGARILDRLLELGRLK
jgi:hypothetical protein